MSVPSPELYDLVIRGGTVVNSAWSGVADIYICGGKIEAIKEAGQTGSLSEARTIVDATGQLVMPGGVDPHCHVGFTSGEYTTLDSYFEATKAAVLGGTTTIVDFAIPRPGQSPSDAIAERRPLSEAGLCDSALHACVVEWDETVAEQLEAAVESGIVTVKMFTTYRNEVMANEDTILKVMKALGKVGGMAVVHAESNHLIENTQTECAGDGRISACSHHETRTELSESASVAEIIAIAESLGTPVYFVHQSTPESVELVRRARDRGVLAFSETVTHHLTLDDGEYAGPHPELMVCCPPLRSEATVKGLRKSVHSGMTDTIGSDHCCYDSAQKSEIANDVRLMPNGLPGVETRLPVIFDQLVVREHMPVERFVALVSANPARLNGLYPRKGVIAVGADADLVVWDPEETRTVVSEDLHMATDYTPYEGRRVTGWPTTVVVAGKVVVEGNVIVDSTARGGHVRSTPLDFQKLRLSM